MKRLMTDGAMGPPRTLFLLVMMVYAALIGLTFTGQDAFRRSPEGILAALHAVAVEEPVIEWALAENLIGAPLATGLLKDTELQVLAVFADSLRTVLLLQANGPQHNAIGVHDLQQGEQWPRWYQNYGPRHSYPGGTVFVYTTGGAPARTGPITLSLFTSDRTVVDLTLPAHLVHHLPEEQWSPARQVIRDGVTVELVKVHQTPAELIVQFRSAVDPTWGSESPTPQQMVLADGTPKTGSWISVGGVSQIRFRRPLDSSQIPALTIGGFQWTTDESLVPLQIGSVHPVGPTLVTITSTRPSLVGNSEAVEVLFAWPDDSPLGTLGVRAIDTAGTDVGPGDDVNPTWSISRSYRLWPGVRPEGVRLGLRGIIDLRGTWELPLHR